LTPQPVEWNAQKMALCSVTSDKGQPYRPKAQVSMGRPPPALTVLVAPCTGVVWKTFSLVKTTMRTSRREGSQRTLWCSSASVCSVNTAMGDRSGVLTMCKWRARATECWVARGSCMARARGLPAAGTRIAVLSAIKAQAVTGRGKARVMWTGTPSSPSKNSCCSPSGGIMHTARMATSWVSYRMMKKSRLAGTMVTSSVAPILANLEPTNSRYAASLRSGFLK
jgi:hypothetical protein